MTTNPDPVVLLPDGNAILASEILSIQLDGSSVRVNTRNGTCIVTRVKERDEAIVVRDRAISDWMKSLGHDVGPDDVASLRGALVECVRLRADRDSLREANDWLWGVRRKISDALGLAGTAPEASIIEAIEALR